MTTATKPRHVLLGYSTTSIHTWSNWLEIWEDPLTMLDERVGLIHRIFEFHIDKPEEKGRRLCLLLEVADGFNDRDNFKQDGDDPGPCSYLAKVAAKALQILADNYFKHPLQHLDEKPSVLDYLELPGVLEKTIWFFRAGRGGESPNIAPTWHKQHPFPVVREFASLLWMLGWEYDRASADRRGTSQLDPRELKRFRSQLVAARTRLLHLPFQLDESAVLTTRWRAAPYEQRFPLDRACKAFLLDRAKAPVGRPGVKPASLEHAYLMGSDAAMVLLLDQKATEERRRLRPRSS